MDCNPPELRNKQVINLLVEARYRLLRHGIFLLGLLVLLYYADFSHQFPGVYKYYSILSVYIIFIGMFYINMYVLVPSFFFRARYVLYLLLLVTLVIAGLSLINAIRFNYLGPHRIFEKPPLLNRYQGTIISASVILVTTTIKLLQRWTRDNERMTELRNLTLNMELNELRNQVNPHFLFNMLNNVKALIRSNPEKAATVIVKLSEFLRSQLYGNTEEKTLLVSEINFLSNFIDLEKIRRDQLSVSIESKAHGQTLHNVFVPPNLFTIFVENAVKHSADISGKDTFINISIAIRQRQLHFTCCNSKSPAYRAPDQKSSGLGLANIKRRLELLYQDRYSLDISSAPDKYTVHLSIPV